MIRRFLVLLLIIALSPAIACGVFVDFLIIPVIYVVRGGDIEFLVTDFWFSTIERIAE